MFKWLFLGSLGVGLDFFALNIQSSHSAAGSRFMISGRGILARRSFLVGTAASIAFARAGGAYAAAPGIAYPLINFLDAGGSPFNRGDKNCRAYLAAIAKLDRAGGGTLVVPPGDYPFSGDAAAVARSVTVRGYGATFRGPNCRITMSLGSRGYNIQGLTMIETSGSPSSFLLNCVGSNCHLKDVHLEKSPPAGGYIAYCQQQTANNLFENISFKGSNGVFLGGHDHEVRGGWAESAYGDDCWVLKSTTYPCYNIRITGFRARGSAALISIGSEIGTLGVDNPSRDLFVKGVTVENCVAENCTYFAYIKPGGVEVYDFRDGVVEDVSINNCRIEDPSGARFRNGLYVSPGRGAIVRRIAMNNFTVNARGASPPVQAIGAVSLLVLNLRNGVGEGSTIEDVVINGLRCTDPHGGVAKSDAAPGEPIHIPLAIEKMDPAVGRIGTVQLRDGLSDGCARMGVFVGPEVLGPVSIADSRILNFAAAIMGSVDMRPVAAYSAVQLQNVAATPSPYAPPGTASLP